MIWRYGTADVVPWANGRGTTRELAAVYQKGRIVWRISVADVVTDGPFSTFPGLLRWHTIFSGAGLSLQSGNEVLRAQPLSPLSIDGSLTYHVTLHDGPCRAFNVIYDPSAHAITMHVHQGVQPLQLRGNDIVFVAQGHARTSGGDTLCSGDAMMPDAATVIIPAADVILLRICLAATAG